MGLDQYAYSIEPTPQTSFNFVEDDYEPEKHHFASWRKHNRLQGWMELLWNEKGKPGLVESEADTELIGSSFNCIDLELNLNDLEGLKRIIVNKSLPETSGFFFGEDSYAEYEEWYKEEDHNFLEEAIRRLGKGHKVYYGSWW